MTNEEKSNIAKLLSVRAETSGVSFSHDAIVTMVEDLADIEYIDVVELIKSWGRTEIGFPHPAKLRAKLSPSISEKDDAVVVASAIITAVSKFGWTNPTSARSHLSGLAWETVLKFGGWLHLCENLNFENEGTIRAQLRQLAEVLWKKDKRGELEELPQLESKTRDDVKSIVMATMKGIE